MNGQPVDARTSEHYGLVREEAMRRPGEWVLVWQSWHPSLGWSIENGKVAAFRPPDAWRATTSRSHVLDDGSRRAEVWVKFVGE